MKEGQEGLEDSQDAPTARDCVIACAAAKVEHDKISSYRSLIAAATLGHDELRASFKANLPEKAAAKRRATSHVGASSAERGPRTCSPFTNRSEPELDNSPEGMPPPRGRGP